MTDSIPYGYSAQADQHIFQSGTNDILGVRRVSNPEEVKTTLVPYGRQLFMDVGRDIFYVKDSSGEIRCFAFKPIPMPEPESFVTQSQFEELKQKYEQLVRSISTNAPAESSVPAEATATAQPVAISATVEPDTGASQAGVYQSAG